MAQVDLLIVAAHEVERPAESAGGIDKILGGIAGIDIIMKAEAGAR